MPASQLASVVTEDKNPEEGGEFAPGEAIDDNTLGKLMMLSPWAGQEVKRRLFFWCFNKF
jgi:hypothetical protein